LIMCDVSSELRSILFTLLDC